MCQESLGGVRFDPQPVRIGIMIGSDSDLKQCREGLWWLNELSPTQVVVEAVITNSIHRNTTSVLDNLEDYPVDVWIVGAGMANHLTGTADAYLRYALKRRTPVIGVAFEGKTLEDTEAACLSIERVPGTQVIFDRKKFVGAAGFLHACRYAAEGNFPEIKLTDGKPVQVRTLPDAIAAAEQLITGGK